MKYVIRNSKRSLKSDAVVDDQIWKVTLHDVSHDTLTIENIKTGEVLEGFNPMGIAFAFDTLLEAEALVIEYQNLLTLRRVHALADKTARDALTANMSKHSVQIMQGL